MNAQEKQPTKQEMEEAREASQVLSSFSQYDRVCMTVTPPPEQGENSEGGSFILPGTMMQVLLDVANQLARGNSVSVIHVDQELSTGEAAQILGVSRPFLVSLLENGEIPFSKPRKHRKVLAKDILHYKAQKHIAREKAVDELAQMALEDGGYDLDDEGDA